MPKTQILEHTKLKEPKMFKVLLLNDDITTMDFVIEILMNIFHHSFEVANNIMLEVHCNGSGVCGIYTQEIALSKQKQVSNAALMANFPLKTRVEEE
ncbi:ATP-dependent Clp protease adaptor ClpS [Campylobacter novaezeelandiae]|uniref:ATP-dependent Clp protease adapter protein ClpS n=1 Tax=Campylobacter novaezeelandiae TaxID=2267891 RepID=A0A4Q9JTP7_9BACT|nr:ATP-dependent Clp protease adaptor ClpS [Campylobacter novaezeelandiae]QWU80420.1 ClpAP chaperone-protease complex specificity factor [Campylobacter novaezeelandiae]TBR77905.1 ATP-dependent Clp protease adaptor ClpS [Campylobacter novaezeelandiae]TBR78505.1 ATP-dependent Clp protease adaptor ClpS [Campylobacter novaezeelandiae]TBR78733.1 ATP-dependent Clp protease adaptor ClpS [Campylobacter novaezeelandiae]TBR80508.1 ATP-dependent Clp protease adaptor ClpS [Campylobacter novaezeelandiae]